MPVKTSILVFLSAAVAVPLLAQPDEARTGFDSIRADALKGHIYFLASEELGGRLSLSYQARVAASYVAAGFYRAGLTPMGSGSRSPVLVTYRESRNHPGGVSFFQSFEMVDAELDREGTRLGATIATPSGGLLEKEYLAGSDFFVGRHWNGNVEVSAPLAFAGYGVSAPEYAYDDFEELDVSGKVVLVLAMEPQIDDPDSAFLGASETIHAYNFYKHEVLRKRGAAAILMVGRDRRTRPTPRVPSGPTSTEAIPNRPSHTLTPPYYGIPLFRVTERVADELLGPSGKTLRELQSEIDATGKPRSIAVPDVTVRLVRPLRDLKLVSTRNVIGALEGSDPALRDEYVIITAHYDHSGATDQVIFHGADDNASGTAAVMALAEAFAANPARPKRSVLFLAFDAEENGLLGAFHYVENPIVALEKTVAVLNMDMIGRNEESATWVSRAADTGNTVNLVGTRYSADLRAVIEKANRAIGLSLDEKMERDDRENWFARSDHFAFATRSIPMVLFSTGEHPDYHTPNDTWDRIDYPKLTRIVRLVYLTAWELANAASRPRFVARPVSE